MEPTTYTYDSGAEETFNLTRGPQTPKGHAVARFEYSDGQVVDGYVNIAWLRSRLDVLDREDTTGTTDTQVTDKMVSRVVSDPSVRSQFGNMSREWAEWFLNLALTEPVRSPESIEIENALIDEIGVGVLTDTEFTEIADSLAERGFQFVPDYSKSCGKGPCALEDGHDGRCRC